MKGNVPERVTRKSPKLPIAEIDRLICACEGVLKSNRLDGRQRLEMEDALTVLKAVTEGSQPEDDACITAIGLVLEGLARSQQWLSSRKQMNPSVDGV